MGVAAHLKVKLDEDLPLAAAEALRAVGYEVATAVEQQMGGWKDRELWEAVQRERRFFITGDKGFGDIRTFPPGSHAGILVLRPGNDGIRPLIDLVTLVLKAHQLEDLAESLCVATPRGVRVRRSASR